MRIYLLRALWLLLVLVMAGCPAPKQGNGATTSTSDNGVADKPVVDAFQVTLLRTDLGIGDGQLVIEADAALTELTEEGAISYTPVGELPEGLTTEPARGDIGLPNVEPPVPGRVNPGTMDVAAAAALLDEVEATELLVLSSPLLVQPALDRIAAGSLTAEALLLLDAVGLDVLQEPAVPVYVLRYDVSPAGFLLGVAAGASSNTQQFVAFASSQDPDADALLAAINGGIRHRMNGGFLLSEVLTPTPDGVIAPEELAAARERVRTSVGTLQANHYFVFAGRATPSIMFALMEKPLNAKVLSGYSDYRQVRPARVLGCLVKHPAPALKALLGSGPDLESLGAKFTLGEYLVSFEDGGTSVTDFQMYAQYNYDYEDVADAVEQAREELLAGELDHLALIEKFKQE